jgi:hypothetical protein
VCGERHQPSSRCIWRNTCCPSRPIDYENNDEEDDKDDDDNDDDDDDDDEDGGSGDDKVGESE